MSLSDDQKKLFSSWLSLRKYAAEIITAYNAEKTAIETQTQVFSDKWDKIKEEEQGWNSLLALTEQKRNNILAESTSNELPFPELSLSSEEIVDAIEQFIEGVRPVVLGTPPENPSEDEE